MGVSPAITLTSTGVAAFLDTVVPAATSTLLAGVIAASLQIDSVNYCGTDPPPDPGLTPADLLAILPSPAPSLQAIAKVGQWFLSQYWDLICQCDTGPQPVPVPPSNPGPVSINPGLPGAGPAQCWNVTTPYSVVAAPAGNVPPQSLDIGAYLLPAANTLTVPIIPGTAVPGSALARAIPPGVTQLNLDMTLHGTIAAGGSLVGNVTFYDANGAVLTQVLRGLDVTWFAPGSIVETNTLRTTAVVPAGGVYWAAYIVNQDTAIKTGTMSFSFFCDGGAAQLAQPCCPPDPTLENLLRQLIALHTGTITATDPPYTIGTAHTGLSGTGTLVFTGAPRALRVDVVSSVQQFIVNPGSPNYYFSMGFITSFAEGTPLKGWRLVYTGQVYPLIPQATEVGWTLPPGLVVNITELM